jgi:hypothetical protein
MSAKTPLSTFAVAVSQMAVQAANTVYPTDYIVEHILKLSNYIIDLVGSSNLSQPKHLIRPPAKEAGRAQPAAPWLSH